MDTDTTASDAAVEPVEMRPTPEAAPTTGDAVVDDVLAEVAAAQSGDLGQRIAAGEQAHERLQERLRDLGGS
ncbi:MAG: hypothetical protein ABIS35_07895 [Terracoccus sp.]